MSQDEIPEEKPIPRRAFEINTVFRKDQKDRKFKNNEVCTSKYTCLTFLPLNLFEQFSKLANSFFLFRLPRVKEILGRKIDGFVQRNDIDLNSITYSDKN